MSDDYKGMAIGILEADGYLACFMALDAAAKAANVQIQNLERNRLAAGACMKMRGSISDVTAAMEVAVRTAEQYGKVTSHTVMASPSVDSEKAFYMTTND
ncbi:MAG: BMC domain-containing protein [Eubacteriales bacterium]|nr:BMC domain-containing protein [Eubacteriales bacterium]